MVIFIKNKTKGNKPYIGIWKEMKRDFLNGVKTEFVPMELKPKLKKYTSPSGDPSEASRVVGKGLISVGALALSALIGSQNSESLRFDPLLALPGAYLFIDAAAEGMRDDFSREKKGSDYPFATFPVEVGYLAFKGLKKLFGIRKDYK